MSTNSSSCPPTFFFFFFHSPILSFLFFASSTTLILYQIGSIPSPFLYLTTLTNSSSSELQKNQLRDSITFLPLNDLYVNHIQYKTWFMTSLDDTLLPGQPKHVIIPSPTSKNRILCLSAHNYTNGNNNFYALAYPEALPQNSTLLKGLTFISDTFYIYDNIWHGLGAVLPFVAWHEANACARPERWVLFHRGQLRTHEMSNWVRTMASAAIGNEVRIEGFDVGFENGPVCFEKAVVCRWNDQGLTVERKREVIGMIRCKAREHCRVPVKKGEDFRRIRVTLLFRTGTRSFKNETAVTEIFESGCRKFEGCEFKSVVANDLTFCEQVKLMAETDVVVTSHGAQLTNMIFMDRNSRILEIFPQGWLEYGGTGQHVFEWLADSAGMKHDGQWKEPKVDSCPYTDVMACFYFFKNGKVGHNETQFADWIAKVLREVKEYKLEYESSPPDLRSIQEEARLRPCPCN